MFCRVCFHQKCIEAEDHDKNEGKEADRKKAVDSEENDGVHSENRDCFPLRIWICWIYVRDRLRFFRPKRVRGLRNLFGRLFCRFGRVRLIRFVDCMETYLLVREVMHRIIPAHENIPENPLVLLSRHYAKYTIIFRVNLDCIICRIHSQPIAADQQLEARHAINLITVES